MQTIAKRLGIPSLKGTRGFLVATLIDALGSGLFMPFSLLYFHVVAGFPLAVIGLVFSIAAIFALFIPPLAGSLVDRFGAKRVVIAAQVLQGCGFLCYLVVHGLVVMGGSVLLVALGQRLFWSAYFTLLVDLTPSEERDQWFGLVGAAQNAGIGLGSFSAGLLVAQTGGAGYALLVIANALSFFLAAGLLIFSPHTAPHSHPRPSQRMNYRAVFQDHPFLAFTATNVIFALGSMLLGIGLPVYGVVTLHLPVWIIGSLLACNTILLATMQTLLVQRLKPYRRTRVLALAGGLWAGWCLLYAFALLIPPVARLPYLFGATGLYTLAELLHAPTSNALAAEASPEALRGRYLALFQMAFSLASILTPALFTILFTLSPGLPWLSGGILLLCASLAMYALERHLPAQAVQGVSSAEPLKADKD